MIGAAKAAIVCSPAPSPSGEAARHPGQRLTPSLVHGTASTERITTGDGFSAKLFASAAGRPPSLGVPDADDIAALAVFEQPAAGKLTGQAISVNGGISAA